MFFDENTFLNKKYFGYFLILFRMMEETEVECIFTCFSRKTAGINCLFTGFSRKTTGRNCLFMGFSRKLQVETVYL